MNTAGLSVLVVEDNPDLRHLFRLSLALAGFSGRAVPPRAVGLPYDPERH